MSYFKLNYLHIIIFFAIVSCKSGAQTLPIYSKAIDKIVSSSQTIKSKSDLVVSSELIPFSLNDVENDIIAKNYLPGFDMFEKHTEKEEKIIEQVRDSLELLNDKLNKNFIKNLDNTNPHDLAENINYVLFFSKIEKKQLFAVMLPYSRTLNKTLHFADLSYGSGYSFLFQLNESGDEIVAMYSGEVHYN